MRHLYLIGLFILTVFACFSQPGKADTAEINSLTQGAYQFYLIHTDSSIRMAKRALELSVQSNNEYQEALSYLALSKAYWAKANFMLSTDFGFKALKYFQHGGHKKELILTHLSLGRTLTELGNYTKGKEFLQQAIDAAVTIHDDLLVAEGYREYSFLLAELGHYEEALQYADLGIELFQKFDQPIDLSILYGRKARIYFNEKDYKKSLEFAYKCIPLDSINGNLRGLSISKFLAAQSEHKFGNRNKAIQLAQSSVQLCEKINNQQWLIRVHKLLADLYKEEGDLLQSIHELTLVNLYKDSLFNAEKNGQAEEMLALYELESKEKTIQLLENENKIRQQQLTNQRLFGAVLIIGIVLLVAILFFMIRLRSVQKTANERLTQKNNEIENQANNLQKLNQLKSKLFSVISHDLRGPVTNLKVLLELISSRAMTAEEFISISGKLKTNIDNTQQTLENLLNWSLTQMQGIKTEAKEISLHSALEQTCNLLEETAEVKKITILKEIPEHAQVMADPNQLQIIFRNLLHNALKFSKTGSTVNLSVKPYGTFWKIIIQDTGIGMSQDEVNSLLTTQNYFSKSGTQQEKGTGLGLLLCKEFIKLNNGELEIKSTPGIGSILTVSLPQA